MVEEIISVADMPPALARQRLAAELTQAVLRAERRLGRSVDRAKLARQLNISTSSLYAYLSGTTLPRSAVLDLLLTTLGISGQEAGRLASLRDAVELAQRLGPRRIAASMPGADGNSGATGGGASGPGKLPGGASTGGRSRRAAAPNGAADVGVATLAVPLPRQLPAVTGDFVGRKAELAELDRLIARKDGSTSPTIITIDGTAGVGKTTFALRWSHQVAERYPDGSLYVNLRGFDPRAPMEPEQALHGFLHALGVAPAAIPADLDTRAALLRSLLAGRSMLVLLDNARSVEHVRPLLAGSPTCLTVITSRANLEGLVVRDGAYRLTLDVLPHPDALALLRGRLVSPGDDAGAALDELARQCAHLPLALSIVGARAAGRSGDALGRLVAELRRVRDRLDFLGSDEADLDLRTIFQWSYAPLPETASRLFRLLGSHPGPDIDQYACAALLGVRELPAAALRSLAAAHLITERSPGRFSFHDLLRGFVSEVAGREGAHAHDAAIGQVLDYYLSAATAADATIQPWIETKRVSQADAASLPASVWIQPPLAGYNDALTWFTEELPTLQAMIDLAAARGFEAHAWRLAWACTVFLRRTGRRTERAAVHRVAAHASRRAGDRAAHATSLRMLADALARLGRRDEALRHLRTSLAEFDTLGDHDGIRQAHLSFARIYESERRHDEALHHARHALHLACGQQGYEGPADGGIDALALADGLTSVSKQQCNLGEYGEALTLGMRALELYSGLGHSDGEANILKVIGLAERKLGRYERAIVYYEQSRELDRELGDRFREAHALDHLADVYAAVGDHNEARARRLEALAMLESMCHPDADLVRDKLGEPPPNAARSSSCTPRPSMPSPNADHAS